MSNDEVEPDVKWWPLIALLVSVFAVWAISWIFVVDLIPDPSGRSAFGDMFGAVNSLFSGLAFAGVIYAILLQRKELKMQRQELKMTRRELRKSARAQKLQSEATKGLLLLEERRRQLDEYERIRNLDIVLKISQIGQNGINGLELLLDNKGAPVFDIEIHPQPTVVCTKLQRSETWYPGPGWVGFELNKPDSQKGPLVHFAFVVQYANKIGIRRSRAYKVWLQKSGKHWIREIETVTGDYPDLLSEIGAHIEDFERPIKK